ncbi:MAG: allantoate amidohydrolase [Silvibacterium sp.]|nr:allantoate amidohydrolase [Silvibacterium sp.]MBV8437528.1 allantoate amidohydrolase [Silvibacterium sp.]
MLAGHTARTETDFDSIAATALARCDMLAKCSDEPGQITRTFLSPAMERCNRLVQEWMRSAGMITSFDRVGNLRGYYAASSEDALRLIIGSHLDTVPNAGRYDGVLGVMLGIGLVEALAGRRCGFGIDVIGFSDEEGVRYGLPFIGSRAATGTLLAPHLARRDADGIAMYAALDAFQNAYPDVVDAGLDPRARAYLEFHIEQGPVLEHAGLALGVVETIAGQSRATVAFRGRAGHAGTTPMFLRRDALAAAAEWLTAVESAASSMPGLVATTGRISCEPDAANVIPGLVRCSLDVRHADDAIRRAAVEDFLRTADAIGNRREIEVERVVEYEQAAVRLDRTLVALADQVVSEVGVSPRHMTSGAGHDAMIMAACVPSVMFFLRSPGGISHHPDEAVYAEDVAMALRAGIRFLERFEAHLDQLSESERKSCTT